MSTRMRVVWTLLWGTLVVVFLALLAWFAGIPGGSPAPEETASTRPSGPPLRIGLVPERDIFLQRKRYRILADYLAGRMGRPVELLIASTYEGVLQDFTEKKIETAFLGSLVAVLAMDRLGTQVVARPEFAGGISEYHGVIFVRADSPVKKLEDMCGRSIGMVRTTTAANVFPGCVMVRLGFWKRPDRPKIKWIGTHDDVLRNVIEGHIDVGAIKNLRLDALLKDHPEWKIRRLANGRCVPSNTLVVRKDLAEQLGPQLSRALLAMEKDTQGKEALAAMGMTRFLPCNVRDYASIYDMVDCVGPAYWNEIGVPGPAPRRPAGWPRPTTNKVSQCFDVNY